MDPGVNGHLFCSPYGQQFWPTPRPLLDANPADDATSPFLTAIALPVALAPLPKVFVQIAARFLVTFDMTVDPFMADQRITRLPQ